MADFVKTGDALAIRTEAASLRWLAEAEGGVQVVRLTSERPDDGTLTTARVSSASPSRHDAYAFGVALARTHAAGASHFGAPPPGVGRHARYANVDIEMPGPGLAWGAFFAEYRMAPYLRGAVDRGAIDSRGARVIESAMGRITAGEHDSELPALCRQRGAKAARTHGDLWGGNVMWSPAAVLIDPVAHGAHAETDLAALALFGSAHLSDTVAGYRSVSELAAGWQDRVGLHQMHMLLVHALLFGDGYGASCVQTARQY